MFREESIWIKNVLETIQLQVGSKVIDFGSSSIYTRLVVQPHIDTNIYNPLKKRGCEILCCDMKSNVGIDIVLDITKKDNPQLKKLKKRFDLGLCCNILEHIVNPKIAIHNIASTIKPGGYLLVTVPYNYFRHEDPIDTMFRPSPAEIIYLIEQFVTVEKVKEEIIIINERRYYYAPVYPNIWWHNFPFIGYRRMINWLIKRWRWKVSAVLVIIKDH